MAGFARTLPARGRPRSSGCGPGRGRHLGAHHDRVASRTTRSGTWSRRSAWTPPKNVRGPHRPTPLPRLAPAARARDPVHPPRTCRPDPAAPSQRLPRWPPTRVRPAHLRQAQRGRALLQPAQAVPRPCHPLRQTRRLLPRRDHRRRDRGVAAQRPTGHGLAAGPSGSPNTPSTPPSRSNHPPRAKCSSAAPGRRTTRFATREGREGMALVAGPRRDREVDA